MILFKVHFMILIALLLAACGGDAPVPENQAVDTTSATGAALVEYTDSLVIDLVGVDSATVLDLLLQTHQVDYRTTLNGAFVTAIDSTENSGDCFWIYTVNGESIPKASDDCFTSDGDRVKWHFRRFGD